MKMKRGVTDGSKGQVVKVRREALVACMTCPLCDKLINDATTISLCLHTFCRKCIFKKLSDEESDCCPVCYENLGFIPVEKLRPDHNIQDIRAKIFPFKSKSTNIQEVIPAHSLPLKRKERSLSSLVVSTPKVSLHTGLAGRRTKTTLRTAGPLRVSSFSIADPTKKEEDPADDSSESSPSTEKINGIVQIQSYSPNEPFQKQIPKKEAENDTEPWGGNVDLWKPLNCLVEAANITKGSKLNSQSSEKHNATDSEVYVPKIKVKERGHKSKVQDDKNSITMLPGPFKRSRLHVISRKRAAEGLSVSSQTLLEAANTKQGRREVPIWFSLVASQNQGEDVSLPQISAGYLRIKDGNLPVSFIQKYLVKKLDLHNEAEVEIKCQGRPVLPTLQLQNLVDLWLPMGSRSKRVTKSVGTSAKDFVMILSYSRRVEAP